MSRIKITGFFLHGYSATSDDSESFYKALEVVFLIFQTSYLLLLHSIAVL